MLNMSELIIQPAARAEIPVLSTLITAALERFRGVVPDKPLSLYIPYSCDVAGH